MKFKTKEDRTWEDLQFSPQFHICPGCVVSQLIMYTLVDGMCFEKVVFFSFNRTYVFNCQNQLLYLITLIK